EHLDNDMTLDPEVREQFEAEANYFAWITLFQQDRFQREMSKLEWGIKAPIHLAKQFGGSLHAALRKYVEYSNNRCALIVLEKASKGMAFQCNKRNFFESKKFLHSFGALDLPETFGFNWPFVTD